MTETFNPTPLKVGLDLDCVLNNLTEAWVDVYNKKHDQTLQLEDINTWDLIEHMPLEENPYDLITHDVLANLRPIQGAMPATRELADDHMIELYIVTASYPESMVVKLPWLEKYFAHIKPANIIIIQDKSLVNMDILVDDGLHNILGFPGEAILFDQPWNRHITEDEGWFTRAHTWEDIQHFIQDSAFQYYEAQERMFDRHSFLLNREGPLFPTTLNNEYPLEPRQEIPPITDTRVSCDLPNYDSIGATTGRHTTSFESLSTSQQSAVEEAISVNAIAASLGVPKKILK